MPTFSEIYRIANEKKSYTVLHKTHARGISSFQNKIAEIFVSLENVHQSLIEVKLSSKNCFQ